MLESEKSYTPQYTNWVKCSDTGIINYKATTHTCRLLSDITIHIDAIHLCHTLYTVLYCSLHKSDIECFYDKIAYSLIFNKYDDICLQASKCSSSANHNVPGWNDYVNINIIGLVMPFYYGVIVVNHARVLYTNLSNALRYCITLEETAKAESITNQSP